MQYIRGWYEADGDGFGALDRAMVMDQCTMVQPCQVWYHRAGRQSHIRLVSCLEDCPQMVEHAIVWRCDLR